MRQAKPDDVWLFVKPADVLADWLRIEPHLGRERAFWTWLVGQWTLSDDGRVIANTDAA